MQIHYDHQVLLDYLISKDTGISCAKYLLRHVILTIMDRKISLDEFVIINKQGKLLTRSG